jgi:hypothetical protein
MSQLVQAPIALTCNPSYSGGLRFPSKQLVRPYLKNTQHTKKGLVE